MLKMAMKIKARALESERRTAAAAAEVAAEAAAVAAALAEQLALRKKGDAEKPPKKPAREVPGEEFLTEKQRKKIEKKLLEQRRKEEKKKEKERKKLEKMQKKKKKKKKKVPEAREGARGREAAAAAAAAAADVGAAAGAGGAGVGAGAGGTNRVWVEWDTDSSDEDDIYGVPGYRDIVWGPVILKAGALSAHLPLLAFMVFSVRSPSWVLDFLLQKRTEQGRGCGFFFGATCCFRMFLGCAAFAYLGGRAKRRGRGRTEASGAFGSGHGARRRGRNERLI